MTMWMLAIAVVVACYWRKRRKRSVGSHEVRPDRNRTAEEERREGMSFLTQGLTSDPQFDAQLFGMLLEAARRFDRKGETQEEQDMLHAAAARLAAERGISAEDACRIIRIVYRHCTRQEMHDAYQRSVNSGPRM